MEREYFIFYRSFYEAIRCMNEKVQLQVYTAIAEYALDGIEPTNLCKEAQGMFLLIRPVIDANNSRFKNGKKGGRPRKNPLPVASEPVYSKSFKEESDKMKSDDIWQEGVCMQFHISKDELLTRLDRFPTHCETECSDKPHRSYGDAQRHFCSWMRIAYKSSETNTNSGINNETLQGNRLQQRRGADTQTTDGQSYHDPL